MKALSKLQGSIIVQAAANDDAIKQFNANARSFIATGALLVAAAIPGGRASPSIAALTNGASKPMPASEGAKVTAIGAAALSISEQERLDAMVGDARSAQAAWRGNVHAVAKARQAGDERGWASAAALEASSRQDFEGKRGTFATTVSRMSTGGPQMPPRAVGRYVEVAASMLEVNSNARTNYASLAERDDALMQRAPGSLGEQSRVQRANKTT